MSSIPFFDPGFRSDPFSFYSAARGASAVSKVEPFGFYALTRYDDVMAALRSPHVFSSAGFESSFQPPWLGDNPLSRSLLAKDPPAHTRLRGLMSRAFVAPVLARVEPSIRSIANDLFTSAARRGATELVSEAVVPFTSAVIAGFLGFDHQHHATYKRWSDDLAGITPEPQSPEHAAAVRRTVAEMRAHLGAAIADRKRRRGGDLVSELVWADAGGAKLDDDEILSFLFLLLPAGLETTSNLVSRAALLLAERPDLHAALRGNLTLIPRFIEELLRWDPPAHAVIRRVAAETVVGDATLPEGAIAMLMLAAANRDPSHFAAPDVFDLEREHHGHVAFGFGAHACLGMGLARLEAKIALETIVTRATEIALERPVSFHHTLTVRGPAALHVRFTT